MDFKIVDSLTSEQVQEWDRFMEEAPYGHVFQSYGWGQFQKIYSGREVLYFYGVENGKTKVLGQIFKRKWPGLPLFNYEVSFGPVFCELADYAEALKYLDSALRKNAAILQVGPRWPMEYFDRLSDICRQQGFTLVGNPSREAFANETVLVDLRRPLPEILASFRFNTRYEIRRAERNGVEVTVGTDPSMMDEFYLLYQGQMAHRQRPPTEKRFFDRLARDFFSDPHRGHIALARHGQQVLSAAVFYRLGPMVWYTFGASDTLQKKHEDTSHLLHWKVMEFYKNQGCAWYDFSGAHPRVSLEDPGYGVNLFKTGFSKHYVQFIPSFEKDYHPSLARFVRLRRSVSDAMRVVSGKAFSLLWKFKS